jgi:putative oxidoreductase
MKWLALVLRLLVGLPMAGLALMYFFVEMPTPELPEAGKALMTAMGPTKWMTVVKVLEVVGGLLLLSGRFVPLGLVILVPITVNIAIWDAVVMKYSMMPLGTVLLALEIVLIWCYWPVFAPFFRAKAPLNGGSL